MLSHWIDFLDGNGFVEVRPPQEWKDIQLELSFLNQDQKLSAQDFTWLAAAPESGAISVADALNDHIADGLTGGVGIFEGLPYQVRLECDTVTYTVLDACINLAADSAEFQCDKIKAPVREVGKIDFVSQRAESFRFEYLYSLGAGQPGRITTADFVDIYYQVGRYPQGGEILLASLTLYITLKETYETVKRIADAAAAILGGATGTAESIAQIIALIVYLGLIIASLINLVNTLVDLLFPWVYYHRGMFEGTLWQRACAFLGLNYSSSIHSPGGLGHQNWLMPPKNVEGKRVGQASTEVGFYEGTFADFIRGQIEKYDGKIKIIGNTLYFEQEMTYVSQATWRIPEVKHEFYGYNASEVPANYVISYQYDGADLYNYLAPGGVNFQVTVSPITVVNKQNILLRNLRERVIPYSLPNVKSSASQVEIAMANVFNGFASLINAVATLFGASAPVIPTIPSSVNILIMDTHLTSIHKNGVFLSPGYTSPATATTIGAEQLFYGYHFYNIPKPIGTYTQGNQWKRYRGYRVPMCCEDYLILKDMNYATYKGNPARLLSISWSPYDQVADLDFEVNEKYTDNLQAQFYVSGTQAQGFI